jgi:hypothetical protein
MIAELALGSAEPRSDEFRRCEAKMSQAPTEFKSSGENFDSEHDWVRRGFIVMDWSGR